MIKRQELTDPNSCMSKAKDDEMTFVLIGRDITAPAVIRFWIRERIRLGKNIPGDPQLIEAEECAKAMNNDLTVWKNLGVVPQDAETGTPSFDAAEFARQTILLIAHGGYEIDMDLRNALQQHITLAAEDAYKRGMNDYAEIVGHYRVSEVRVCNRAPAGWRCSRLLGHEGPCAAWPIGING